MTPFPLPTNAAQFVETMQSIWDGPLYHHYAEWESAHRVARLCATLKWPARIKTGETGQVYEFPDGSRAWVKTSACRVMHRRAPTR